MKISMKCHLEALTELVETISLTGAAALALDLAWCIYDMVKGGGIVAKPYLFMIATGLAIALAVCGMAIYKYHMRTYKASMHDKLQTKLKLNTIKNKHNKVVGVNKKKGEQHEQTNSRIRGSGV